MKTQERSEGHKTFARLMSREPSCTPLSLDTQGHSGHPSTFLNLGWPRPLCRAKFS